MAKAKTREITITQGKKPLFKIKKSGNSKSDYDFEGISALRRVLSNERARLLHAVKAHKPGSIYELAKVLDRSFKSVSDDIKLLERFGFIQLVAEKTKNRVRHRPEVAVDTITIHVKI